MLVLSGGQVESLFDGVLPVEVRELPADLVGLDALLDDPALLEPVERAWGQAAREHGRPSIPIERFVRSMVIKQRSGWGYETLGPGGLGLAASAAVCRIALTERVPDESTIRKLCRRLGGEVVDEICRVVIATAVRDRRFVPRAARVDSTVVEADIRYPSDLALAGDATKTLAREAAKAGELAGDGAPRVRDRSRAAAKRLRSLNRTLAKRLGQGKETALRLTGEAGKLVERSVRDTRRLAARLRDRARGRGAQAKLAAARCLDELADRAGKVAHQIRQRVAGEKITDRLVSLSDPDARPIRKGKLRADRVWLRRPDRRDHRAHPPGRARPDPSRAVADRIAQRVRPASTDRCRAQPARDRLARSRRRWRLPSRPVAEHLPASDRTFIAGRQAAGSRHTNRRLACYRVGCEGRISHLKRRYGQSRSRLKGHDGQQAWTAWGILAYNLDTLAIRDT